MLSIVPSIGDGVQVKAGWARRGVRPRSSAPMSLANDDVERSTVTPGGRRLQSHKGIEPSSSNGDDDRGDDRDRDDEGGCGVIHPGGLTAFDRRYIEAAFLP